MNTAFINMNLATLFVLTVVLSMPLRAASSEEEPTTSRIEEIDESEPRLLRQFARARFVYTGSSHNNEYVHYRIHVPDEPSDSGKYPVLLWLHGFGQAGDENSHQVLHIDYALANWREEHGAFPAIVLAPQCPADHPLWFRSTGPAGDADEPLSVAWALLEHTRRTLPVDDDRVYLAGVSSGGTACWEMVMRYPNRFAAVAPMASASADASRVELLSGPSIWAFQSESDPGIPLEEMRAFARLARDRGCVVKLTDTPGGNHDCWTAAFQEHDLLEWLLKQRRGSRDLDLVRAETPPWWVSGCVILTLGITIWATFSEVSRRRLKHQQTFSIVDEPRLDPEVASGSSSSSGVDI